MAARFAIAYRDSDKGIKGKIRDQLSSLDASIAAAFSAGVPPPCTGIVLLGGAWANRQREIFSELHDWYNGRAEHIKLGTRRWWNFVDLIAWPGGLLKKHDLFAKPRLGSKRYPCLMPLARLGEQTRPLLPMRAFMSHRVENLRKLAAGQQPDWDGPAWANKESSAIVGDVSDARRIDMTAILLARGTPDILLWHRARTECRVRTL